MNVLLDANVLLRLADPTSAMHSAAATAVATLRAQGDALHIVPQCVYEFWVVVTRPGHQDRPVKIGQDRGHAGLIRREQFSVAPFTS